MDNTFCSTDPDKYYEVECPVNYVGVAKQLKWYVSSINTIYAAEMFGPEDYILFDRGEVRLKKYYKSIEDSDMGTDIALELTKLLITISSDDLDRYKFTCLEPFKILDMSYNLKQLYGFYYLREVKLESHLENGKHVINAKARGYKHLSPIWFLLSNLGSPNIISSSYSPYDKWYPSIAMKIQNSFTNNQPLQYGNSDFMNITQASSLGNLRVRLVDCNLKPVKLLYPLYVTVSFSEMDEEHAAIDEVMQEQDTNPDTSKMIGDYYKKITEIFMGGLKKVEKGIHDDSELPEQPKPQEAEVHASDQIEDHKAEEMTEHVVKEEHAEAQDVVETGEV